MTFGGALEDMGAIFAPGMRHEQERRRLLAVMREDPEDGAPPRTEIDLDAGLAVIRLPKKAVPVEEPVAEPAE